MAADGRFVFVAPRTQPRDTAHKLKRAFLIHRDTWIKVDGVSRQGSNGYPPVYASVPGCALLVNYQACFGSTPTRPSGNFKTNNLWTGNDDLACKYIRSVQSTSVDPFQYINTFALVCSHIMLGAPEFVYPFFPQVSHGNPGQSINGWHLPTDSRSRRFFRLPVVDITTITCTPRSVACACGEPPTKTFV